MESSTLTLPNETAMQQAWRFRLWHTGRIPTVQGTTIEVVDAGKLNHGPGPDFKDAKIRIDGTVWVGNVEIHRKASDWERHGHSGDRAYDNVLLHVVGVDDYRVRRSDGSEVAQVVMSVGDDFASMFNTFLNTERYVLPMCGGLLADMESVFKADWLTSLAYERLQRKSTDIRERLNKEQGNWYQTVFVALSRGLGFGTNADNMERLARSIPFKILLRHTDDVEVIEALLFGQGGLLNGESPADGYEERLAREYAFYSHKYGLKPIERPLWNVSARNISNTPYRRIALLAQLISTYGTDIGSRLTEAKEIGYIKKFLNVELSEYWSFRYTFGRTSGRRLTSLGKQSQDLLVINVFAPLIFCRGTVTDNTELRCLAAEIWETTDGEQNGITRGFERYGIKARDAFTSQALIQLHREYCERRRCPECRLGHRLLSGCIGFKR